MTNIDVIQILSSYGVPQDEEKFQEALDYAIKALEWTPVKTSDDYPKESGDYLTVLKDTAFHDFTFTDITSFEGITAEWDLKPQYKVIAWKAYEPYKGE